MITLLLLEDDRLYAETIAEFLIDQEYRVIHAKDSEEALNHTYLHRFDLFILDVNVPKGSGFSFLETMRHAGNTTPAIFLTSRTSPDDAVRGFATGCDDYLRKPCSLEELGCRIRAVLRNRFASAAESMDLGEGLSFDITRKLLLAGDDPVPLNPKERSLLALLIRHRTKTVTTAMIDAELWPDGVESSYGSIRVYIANLKKALGDNRIENIRGVGYVFKV